MTNSPDRSSAGSERDALATRLLMQMMDCDEAQVRQWSRDFDRKWLVAIGFIVNHVPTDAQSVGVRLATIEECAKAIEPQGPRPCDCEPFGCYCQNYGDAQTVAAWDADMANADRIRALAAQPPSAPVDRYDEAMAAIDACIGPAHNGLSAGNVDDPTASKEWNEGCDFAMEQLCRFLGVDPSSVSWDAATETVDGDVQAVIGNILCAKFGEDWGPKETLPDGVSVSAACKAIEFCAWLSGYIGHGPAVQINSDSMDYIRSKVHPLMVDLGVVRPSSTPAEPQAPVTYCTASGPEYCLAKGACCPSCPLSRPKRATASVSGASTPVQPPHE